MLERYFRSEGSNLSVIFAIAMVPLIAAVALSVGVDLGGNGSLVGEGVTFFIMENAQFRVTANQTLQMTPPENGPFGGITLYQPEANGTQITINGGSDSFINGFIYAPGAHVFHAGNSSMAAEARCLRIVSATIEMTGNSSIQAECETQLGGRTIYAGRHNAIDQ